MKKSKAASEAARKLAARRQTYAGGRPRDTTKFRCPCGKHTLKRCETRGGSSDHKPSCPWYREPKP